MTDAEKQLKKLEEEMRRGQDGAKQGKPGKSGKDAKPYAGKKESHPLASFLIGLVLIGGIVVGQYLRNRKEKAAA